jgi:hypothetical protein
LRVQVLPGIRFPEIIDRDEEHLATAYVLPDEALADVPPERAEPFKVHRGEIPKFVELRKHSWQSLQLPT